MAFMEQKLQPIDLLGAWQARQQREAMDMENERRNRGNPLADEIAREQLRGIKNQNEMEELKRRSLLAAMSAPVTTQDSPFSIGARDAAIRANTDKYLGMMGYKVPEQGPVGGLGRSGGMRDEPDPPNPALDPANFIKHESADAKLTRDNLAATAEENKTKQGVADAMAMETLRQKGAMDQQDSINKANIAMVGMKTADQEDKQAQKDEAAALARDWKVRERTYVSSAKEAARKNGLSPEATAMMISELPQQWAKYSEQGEFLNMDMLAKQYRQRFNTTQGVAGFSPSVNPDRTTGGD